MSLYRSIHLMKNNKKLLLKCSPAFNVCVIRNDNFMIKQKSRCFMTLAINQESLAVKTVQKHDWNQAMSDAEKIVGSPTSFLSLKWLLSDKANGALHLRKLVGSHHRLVKTAKNLLYNGKNIMQPWGLIVLLVSKASGHVGTIPEMEQDKSAGVLHSQRALSEIAEMIRISNLVHQGLVNLQPLSDSETDLQDLQRHANLHFSNKIALLSGDYLLVNSFAKLAGLRNQEIVVLISSAVRDLAEAEFIGNRDVQNVPLPIRPAPVLRIDEDYLAIDAVNNLKPLSLKGIRGDSEKEWTIRHISDGRLLGKSCQGALKLAGLPDAIQREGYIFGRHLALAWQACMDLEPFESNEFQGGTFSLVSAPVIYHLEYNPALYSEIEKGLSSIDNIDFRKIFDEVINGPGIQKTRNLHTKHSNAAMNVLNHLPLSDARTALENIMLAMQDL